MDEAIRKLPPARSRRDGRHDPLDRRCPRASRSTSRSRSSRSRAASSSTCATTSTASRSGSTCRARARRDNVMIALFNCIDPDVPHNAGAFRRVEVLLREGCIAGGLVGSRLGLGGDHERAEPPDQRDPARVRRARRRPRPRRGRSAACGPGFAVVSGDRLAAAASPTSTRTSSATTAARPAPSTTAGSPTATRCAKRAMFRDSIEILEQKYPIRVRRRCRIRTDSEGAGRRRGAPGAIVEFGPKQATMNASYVADCSPRPARGTRGGGDAAAVGPVPHHGGRGARAAGADRLGAARARASCSGTAERRRRLRRSARARGARRCAPTCSRVRLPRARAGRLWRGLRRRRARRHAGRRRRGDRRRRDELRAAH